MYILNKLVFNAMELESSRMWLGPGTLSHCTTLSKETANIS